MEKTTTDYVTEAIPMVENLAADTVVRETAVNSANSLANSGISTTASSSASLISSAAIWFLIGGILAILFYLLFEILREKSINKARTN